MRSPADRCALKACDEFIADDKSRSTLIYWPDRLCNGTIKIIALHDSQITPLINIDLRFSKQTRVIA